MHRTRRWGGMGIIAAVAFALCAAPALAQKTELLVYTALETDQIKAYEDAFKKANPNIDLKWVRDSTGVITSKLLAEKANPQADVVFGVSASSLAVFDNEGMLLPYAPKGLDKVSAKYREQKAFALGVHDSSANLGEVIGPLALGFLLNFFDWRTS